MKITLEIPDQTPASTPSAPAMSSRMDASPEPAATPEPKATQPAAKKRDALLQGNRVEKQKSRRASAEKTSEEEPQPTVVENSSLASFALQGGVNDISDPNRSNPNVFRFVAPRGDA